MSSLISVDNFNSDLAKNLLLSVFPYYQFPEYLRFLPSSEIKSELVKRCGEKNGYFTNKNVRLWPKIQSLILTELLQHTHDDIGLYSKFSISRMN